jgi:hypothetical protein
MLPEIHGLLMICFKALASPLTESFVVGLQGISATALKKACRELGVERWPYCRKRETDGRSADEESRADTSRCGSNSPVSNLSISTSPDLSVNVEKSFPADLMEMLHRNAVLVLEAAKKLEVPENGAAGGGFHPHLQAKQ